MSYIQQHCRETIKCFKQKIWGMEFGVRGSGIKETNNTFKSTPSCYIYAWISHLCVGASRTLAIQLAFGRKDQPEVSNPIASIRAWVRHARDPALTFTESARGWRARCNSIRKAIRDDTDPWEQTSSPMAHTIMVLLQLGITPAAPLLWLWDCPSGTTQRWNMKCPEHQLADNRRHDSRPHVGQSKLA